MTASVAVWFDDLAVGQVDVAADGSLSLRYAVRWLRTAGAFPLSVTMPLRAEPYPSDVISPWLANLLPEEEQLQVQEVVILLLYLVQTFAQRQFYKVMHNQSDLRLQSRQL